MRKAVLQIRMAAAKYELNLNNLLSKDYIDECDVLEYIKNLAILSKSIKHQNSRFKTYAPIVKSWIGAYQTIFSDAKINEKALKCINKSCSVITEIFFNLMQTFRQFEPEYSQELCYHWKDIVSRMSGSKRANSFTRHIELFKTIVENLRTAKDRCEQLAILGTLKLYIDHVPSDKLTILKERYNKDIVEKLIDLKRRPTILNQHAFLHDINAMGRCIISLQPTKIICEQLSLYFNILNYGLWVDFNLRDNSIICVAVSFTDNTDHCLAVVTGPKIKENVSDEHVLKIRGTWSILRNGETFRKRISVSVFVPMKDRNPMWKSKVRSIFPFVAETHNLGDSFSQECSSQVTDKRFVYKHPLEDGYVQTPSQWSQRCESDASSSIICLPKDTTLKQLYGSNKATQVQQRPNENSMLVTPLRENLQQDPKKCEKDVAETNYSVGDGDKTLLFDDSIDVEQNLTATKEEITPTAQQQLDDDENERIVSAEKSDLFEKQRNEQYLNKMIRKLDIPKISSPIEDFDHSSGISFSNNITIDDQNSDDQDEIENDKDKHSGSNWNASNGKQDLIEEKQIQDIEMLEDSTMPKHNHRAESRNSAPFSNTQSDVEEEQNEHIEKFIHETESSQSPGRSSVNLVVPRNEDKTFSELKEIEIFYQKPTEKSDMIAQPIENRETFRKSPPRNSYRNKSSIEMKSPARNCSRNQTENVAKIFRPWESMQASQEEFIEKVKALPRNSSRKETNMFVCLPALSQAIREKAVTELSSSQKEKSERKDRFQLFESTSSDRPLALMNSQERMEENSLVFRLNQDPQDPYFTKIHSSKPKSLEVKNHHNERIVAPTQTYPNKSVSSSKHEDTQSEDIEMSDKLLTPTTRKVSNWATYSEVKGDDEVPLNHDEKNEGNLKIKTDDDKQPCATIRLDGEGMVFDDKGCVFVNDEELQEAWDVYIENSGLVYLKSDEFKSLQYYQRERVERELRTIYTMINEGFDVPHQNGKSSEVDHGFLSSEQSMIHTARGTTKRKSSSSSLSSSFGRSMNQLNATTSRVEQTRRRTIDSPENVGVLITRRNSSDVNLSDDDKSSFSLTKPSKPTQQLKKQEKFDSEKPSDNKMNPNDSINEPQYNRARNISSQNNFNHSKSNDTYHPDQINTTITSHIVSKFPEKLPIHAAKRKKSMHQDDQDESNSEQDRNPLPWLINDEKSDLAKTNDTKEVVPKATERINLNAGHKHHIQECSNVGCNLLVNHLNELMKQPKETCDSHKRLLVALHKGLQNIRLEDHRQLNADLAVLMKTAVATIKSVCNKATLDAAAS